MDRFKNINFLISVAILIVIIIVLFFSRFIFFYKYEPEYYENWYYHSQWSYPQSARGISDGELYKFVGYRLAEGENPFNISYEVPPFAKYLYGLSEKFLGSPYPITIFLYISSICLLFLLLKNLFSDKRLILLSLLLFVTTPFVATQVRETMLDLPLMVLYLAHTFFFIRYLSNQQLKELVLAGIFLGLATGTKFGAYTPGVLILNFLILISLNFKKNILLYFLYLGTVIAGYVLAFFSYFSRHPNPIPWFKLHEKVLDFYLSSEITVDYFNQWRSIFLNSYQGWWQPGKITNLGDWSLILPIGVLATLFIFFKDLKNKNKVWVYISGITLVFLITNTFISFWPRYLMPSIPLFIVMIAYIFRKKGFIIIVLILLNIPLLINSLATDNPKGDFEASARFMNTRANRELYRSIDPNLRKDLPEEKFIDINEEFFDKLNTKKVRVNLGDIKRKDDYAIAEVEIKYETKYGELAHFTNFEFIKINGQWKMKWKWDYLWPGFTPESKLVIEEREDAIKKDKWKAVYIMPRVMFDWNKHLGLLSMVTQESTITINDRMLEVVPDKYPRFAGFLDRSLGSDGIDQALAIPGVTLRDNERSKAHIFLENNSKEKIEILLIK